MVRRSANPTPGTTQRPPPDVAAAMELATAQASALAGLSPKTLRHQALAGKLHTATLPGGSEAPE